MTRLSEEQVHRHASPDPGPPEVAERRESAARVLDVLETLPTNQREVIRLKFQNGFSYQEISRISGHSVSNVGYLIHAGLKTIRGQLADGQTARAQSRRRARHEIPPHDDPRLTAYALGELDDAERSAIEVLLAESPESRQFVEDIRATARAPDRPAPPGAEPRPRRRASPGHRGPLAAGEAREETSLLDSLRRSPPASWSSSSGFVLHACGVTGSRGRGAMPSRSRSGGRPPRLHREDAPRRAMGDSACRGCRNRRLAPSMAAPSTPLADSIRGQRSAPAAAKCVSPWRL